MGLGLTSYTPRPHRPTHYSMHPLSNDTVSVLNTLSGGIGLTELESGTMWFLSLLPLLLDPLSLLTSAASSSSSSSSSGYCVKTPPLTTNYTYTVGTDPWTMYPRPQMTRDRWQSLNGVWSYKNASNSLDVYGSVPTGDLGQAVLVPSCLESALSGRASLHLFRI